MVSRKTHEYIAMRLKITLTKSTTLNNRENHSYFIEKEGGNELFERGAATGRTPSEKMMCVSHAPVKRASCGLHVPAIGCFVMA